MDLLNTIVRASQESKQRPGRETIPSFEELKELPLVNRALTDLAEGLPQKLSYHSLQHTLNVMEEVYNLAVHDKLGADDVELLVIAAADHDWGYLERNLDNEPIGARKAVWEMMKSGGYSLPEMFGVGRAILATALERRENGVMVQRPHSELGRYLCDADLTGFGKDRFFQDTLNVLKEVKGKEVNVPEDLSNDSDGAIKGFLRDTLRMIEAHHWQTNAATEMYQDKKAANVENLQGLVDALERNDSDAIQRFWKRLLPD